MLIVMEAYGHCCRKLRWESFLQVAQSQTGIPQTFLLNVPSKEKPHSYSKVYQQKGIPNPKTASTAKRLKVLDPQHRTKLPPCTHNPLVKAPHHTS